MFARALRAADRTSAVAGVSTHPQFLVYEEAGVGQEDKGDSYGFWVWITIAFLPYRRPYTFTLSGQD